MFGKPRWSRKIIRFIEFFVVGLGFGFLEDLFVVRAATDAELSLRVIVIAFSAALIFAIFSEIIVDHPRFWEIFFRKEQGDE